MKEELSEIQQSVDAVSESPSFDSQLPEGPLRNDPRFYADLPPQYVKAIQIAGRRTFKSESVGDILGSA